MTGITRAIWRREAEAADYRAKVKALGRLLFLAAEIEAAPHWGAYVSELGEEFAALRRCFA